MELLRKEMERVGLNNHKHHHHHHHNHDHDHGSSKGDYQDMENDEQEEANKKKHNGKNKKNNNNEQKTTLRTPADIYEHPSFYSFILDMPGLDAHNIKVKVENGVLHVAGKKKKKQMGETEMETVKVIRAERRRARYMRKFTLPGDASHEDVKATYKDGVLSITVAKRPLPFEQSMPNSPTTVSIS